MDYRKKFKDINETVRERYELAMERIASICFEETTAEPYRDYFVKTAGFIRFMKTLWEQAESGELSLASLEQLKLHNARLYEDVAGQAYETSYANPAYAVEKLGSVFGGILSFLYMELRGMIVYAYEGRLFDMTICAELFLQVYCLFEETAEPSFKEVKDAIYWYVSDYSDETVEYRIREGIDPELDFATDIIMKSDLTDLRYLYAYGEYVTENEIKTAQYLNALSEQEIEKIASAYTEGYRIGFILGRKDLSKKKTVNIRYCLGFERIVRKAVENFCKMGLQPVIYRAAVNSINKRMHNRIGYYGAVPNRQMDYDHRFDNALYLDKAFVERKVQVTKVAYENLRELAALHAGPAVIEVFGETPFEPEDKKEAFHLDERQRALNVSMNNEIASIINTYIKGEERSFTIIAFPVPQIGPDFEEIFAETVKINTLDYNLYRDIQQNIIDVLDTAEYVRVKGCNGNTTDIRVSIKKAADPQKETVFENCVADVNIPLGEVFTSPVLKGTQGVLNVSRVYLNDVKFKNLTVIFQDGMITDYSCDNFEEEQKNRDFVRENVLFGHETLPMGEFAIGTNTLAYVMANKYDIVYKLPILIVEKMGPHFAVGDTCYTWAEDTPVYNPDGKEIISRDNEVSILRKTDVSKAYFNCHTDITIPYEEIGSITAVGYDGRETAIIRNGRFVLEGTDELNKPFEN
jgi:leucyl aminopeptidase (aminopeptidase T)